jgi:hypothetical protein
MAQRVSEIDAVSKRSDDALIALVRLLARSAAREHLERHVGTLVGVSTEARS